MDTGFPLSLPTLWRCPHEKGTLELDGASIQTDRGIRSGRLRCSARGAVYAIEEGIVRLLSQAALDSDSKHELAIRDRRAKISDPHDESSAWHQMELVPTLETLAPLAGVNVLELGCGAGRLTVLMAERGAGAMAVDFSLASLRVLASRILPHWRIGLINADCTRFAVQTQSFGRVSSTLVSNLPTARHRAAMMQLAANAIGDGGKFVFSTHHYGLRQRLRVNRNRGITAIPTSTACCSGAARFWEKQPLISAMCNVMPFASSSRSSAAWDFPSWPFPGLPAKYRCSTSSAICCSWLHDDRFDLPQACVP